MENYTLVYHLCSGKEFRETLSGSSLAGARESFSIALLSIEATNGEWLEIGNTVINLKHIAAVYLEKDD